MDLALGFFQAQALLDLSLAQVAFLHPTTAKQGESVIHQDQPIGNGSSK